MVESTNTTTSTNTTNTTSTTRQRRPTLPHPYTTTTGSHTSKNGDVSIPTMHLPIAMDAVTTTTTTTTTSRSIRRTVKLQAGTAAAAAKITTERRDDVPTTATTTNHHHSPPLQPPRKRKQRRQKRRRRHPDEWSSFVGILIRVATIVVVGIWLLWWFTLWTGHQDRTTNPANDDDNDDNDPYSNKEEEKESTSELLLLVPPPPQRSSSSLSWNLTLYAQQFDAYAMADYWYEQQQQQQQQQQSSSSSSSTHNDTRTLLLFWQAAAGLRNEFAERYGGRDAARAILDRALDQVGADTTTTTTSRSNIPVLPNDLVTTACRIWSRQQEQPQSPPTSNGTTTTNNNSNSNTLTPPPHPYRRPTFRFAFGGYSVTVGRGNLFAQSYPLVMEQQLQTVFDTLGLQLRVRNAAVGGCPSFPYGFCAPNFWGDEPDVVSWDYSMNEAGGDFIGLEAYMRHIMNQYPNQQPKLIVKDTHMAYQRRNLLQYYYNQSLLMPSLSQTARDPIVIHTEPAAEPFLKGISVESDRPVGFQEWRKFGTPLNAPGQTSHHPAVKEHEFIAWILTMYFLSALEVVAIAAGMNNKTDAHSFLYRHCPKPDTVGDVGATRKTLLPEPMYAAALNSTKSYNSVLFGEKSGQVWSMNDVHCRTSFEPIVSGDLSGIVLSGGVGEEINVMLPKSKMFYNSGWVLDLGEDEKKAKRNLDRFEGHGFIDRKKGYYGIFASGSLQLFLPHEAKDKDQRRPVSGDPANLYFKSIVTCEVNEKRRSSACHSVFDIHYMIGGANATQISSIDTPATTYYGRKICTHIMVPATSKLTTVAEIHAAKDFDRKRSNTHRQVEWRNNQVGLLLTITVTNHRIVRRDDACSISHVVWEQL